MKVVKRTMRFGKSGDTIVEVMIAIIVLGAAIGGAFAITNKSQLKTQANHERYQAQMYANMQAERLRDAYSKYIADGHSRGEFSAKITSGGCLGGNSIDSWQNSCTVVEKIYNISVDNVSGAGAVTGLTDPLTYKIHVEWDRLGGGDQDSVELVYGL